MKKTFTLLFIVILSYAGNLQAQYFQVAGCSGTLGLNTYGPMYTTVTANSTNRTAVIYPSSQLTGISGTTITNMYFHRFSTTGTIAAGGNFKIYLVEVALTDWGTADLDWAATIAGATLVYNGDPSSIVGSSDGWKNFPLITNFAYSGTNNLAVLMEYTNPTAGSAITWTYEYTAPCISTTNSNTTKYLNNTTGTLPALLSLENYRRPYVGFDVLLTCYPPTAITATAVTGTTATISWTAPVAPPASGYDYYVSTSATAPTAGTTPTGSTAAGVTTANLSGLTAGTRYYVWVRSNCGAGDLSPWTSAISVFTIPSNDECINAISLTQGATCVNTAGSTAGATLSMAAAPCFGNPDDDVWYSFVATGTDAQIQLSSVVAVVGTSTDTYFQVMSGTCGALTSMMCNDPLTGIVGGLTPGQTYYIRVYMYGAGTSASFNICVNDVAAAPTTCSTLSAPADAATVGGTPTITWSATTNASSYQLYLDANPTPTTLYATTFNNSGTSYTVTTPLSPGVYYWYVLPVNSLGQPASCATIRSFTVVAAPSNDDCSAAAVLVASPNATCNNTAGTTIGATQSNETATTCSNTGTGDDVWYSFVAVSTTHSVALSGTSQTSAVSIYSGTCGSLTLLACGTTNAFANGLTVSATYYVRVYTTSTVSATTTNFNICVTTPPLNDECSGSISMPLTTYGAACTYTAVNTTGATESTLTGQANACTGTGIDDDVWYTFTSTFAGTYTFSYTGLTATSGTASTVGMNIYTGSCGALTEVGSACSSGFGSGGTGSRTVVLAAGVSYTLRLSVGSSPNTGTFNFCITAPPAPPANDDCAGAIALPTPSATATCTTPTAGTTVGGTQSADAAPSCSATGTNDDVWYSFVATATTHTVLITDATTTTAAAIYTGSCGGLTQILNACGSGGAAASGLTIGTTYYVRVYSTSTTVTLYSDFNICVVSGAPANDDCGGAIALPTPSTTNTCAGSLAGTTLGASTSTEAAPSCSATGTNDDVWYSFVATSSVHAVLISNATNTTAAAIYTGTCGTLTQVALACGSGTTGSAQGTGLTPGNTYYVRVYTTSTTVGTYSNFNICIVSPPANDDCAGAISLSVSANNSCSAATPGSTLAATATSGEATSTCSATGMNDDVWYSFEATATTHTVSLGDPTSTSAATVYSGSCGTLIQVACASSNTIATGLSIGATYYVRVYTTSTTVGTYSNFNICIGVLPSNDDCAGAISLVASTDITCNAVAGSTIGATASTETAPTCSATGINDDVWYSFVATATSHVVSLTNESSTTAAAVYSGSCGSLVQVACASATTTAAGLTIGNTYYVRVYTTTATVGTFSNFNICVSGLPANDNCPTATTLTDGVVVNGSTVGATQSMAPEICGTVTASSALDVWYQFTALQNGAAIVSVINVSGSFDAVVQVYSGTCGALANIGCADGPGAGGSETVNLSGLVAGQTYYVRVHGYTAAMGTFSIFVSGAAVPVTIEYFRGSKQVNGNYMEWKVNCTGSPSATMQLERSVDARRFEAVHSITATATRCLQPFNYTDASPMPGMNYYRLKSEDAAGKLTYSGIIAILNKDRGFEIVNIVPNPVQSSAILNVASATASSMSIRISDVAGKQVYNQSIKIQAGSNQIPVNVSRLSAGMYYLTAVTLDGVMKTVKFIKE